MPSVGSLTLNRVTAPESINFVVSDFGAVGDGAADDTDAWQRANDRAEALGGGTVWLEHGATYSINSAGIRVASGVRIRGNGARVKLSAAASDNAVGGLIYAMGTESAKVALGTNAAAGSVSITLPSAHGIAEGDWLGFESDIDRFVDVDSASWHHNGREIVKVLGVSGNTVTTQDPLFWDYDVADDAVFWKMTPVTDIVIEDLTIFGDDPETNTGYSIFVLRGENIVLRNVRLENAGGGVVLQDVKHGYVDGLTIDSLANQGTSRGYGLFLASDTTDTVVNGLRAYNCRHAVTTIYDERTGGDTDLYGGPRRCTINGAVGVGSEIDLAVFDTHEGSMDIKFNGCIAHGGGTGFQDRSHRTQFNNCTSLWASAPAVRISSTAVECQVNGGEFAYAASGFSTAGLRHSIRGARIHTLDGKGVELGGEDEVVDGCEFWDWSNGSPGNHGAVVANGATGPVVTHNIIRKGANQGVAIVQMPTDAFVAGNVLVGFTSLANAFFGCEELGVYENVFDGAITQLNSAAELGVPVDGNLFVVNGTTSITSFSIAGRKGRQVTLLFTGVLTFTNGNNLHLDGDFTTSSLASITLIGDGTDWYEIARSG